MGSEIFQETRPVRKYYEAGPEIFQENRVEQEQFRSTQIPRDLHLRMDLSVTMPEQSQGLPTWKQEETPPEMQNRKGHYIIHFYFLDILQ